MPHAGTVRWDCTQPLALSCTIPIQMPEGPRLRGPVRRREEARERMGHHRAADPGPSWYRGASVTAVPRGSPC